MTGSAKEMANAHSGIDYDNQVAIDPVWHCLRGQSLIAIQQPWEITLALSIRFQFTSSVLTRISHQAARWNIRVG